MLGNSTIRYICDTHHLNIICLILYFDIFPFFGALFPLQHICYYLLSLNRTSGPSHCVLVYIFKINLSFLQSINRDYSRLLFDYIAYSANNTGIHCDVVIYQHKVSCNTLIIILLLFCLSRLVPMYPHVVYCLHIYNTFVVLTTNEPRLFTVVILFHHIFYEQYGRTLHLRHQPTQR